ncbi:hypothetical protein MTO96_036413 [Rhipicephalus appendiculatus]
MSKCTEKSIQYNRSYYINSQVRTERLEGWFLKRRRDEMFVAVIGNMPVIAERLVYSTKDSSCGVFQVVLPFPCDAKTQRTGVSTVEAVTYSDAHCQRDPALFSGMDDAHKERRSSVKDKIHSKLEEATNAFNLTLSLSKVAAEFDDFQEKSSKTHIPNIRKFLNTSEPIWTYNSTLPESLPCTVDVMLRCNKLSILYNRSYYMHPKVLSELLQGWFKIRRKDKMTAGKVGKRTVVRETILYVNRTGGCAVMRSRLLLPGEEPWYDLRVRNSIHSDRPIKRLFRPLL